MPTATTAQRHKLNRDPINDPHVILLEFQEDGQAAIERAAINTEDVVWQGNTYIAASMTLTAPTSSGEETSASVTASNISRVIGRVLLATDQRVTCRIIVTDTSIPDSVLIDTRNHLVLSDATIDAETVAATLAARMSLLEPVPFRQTTRNTFPGVWIQ